MDLCHCYGRVQLISFKDSSQEEAEPEEVLFGGVEHFVAAEVSCMLASSRYLYLGMTSLPFTILWPHT